MGHWALCLFQHLPAFDGFQGLPARVSLATGRGPPYHGWAKDPASHLSSNPHTYPMWPSLPAQCPAAPWRAPLDRAGSC